MNDFHFELRAQMNLTPQGPSTYIVDILGEINNRGEMATSLKISPVKFSKIFYLNSSIISSECFSFRIECKNKFDFRRACDLCCSQERNQQSRQNGNLASNLRSKIFHESNILFEYCPSWCFSFRIACRYKWIWFHESLRILAQFRRLINYLSKMAT